MIICALLCACGKEEPTAISTADLPVPAETATPSPEPTPVIILGQTVTPEQLAQGYTFELFGQEVNTKSTTELHYLKESIGDTGLEKFREVLPFMENLAYLTFDRCDTSDEAVAALREEFPDANIAWRIFFDPFSCMTDVEKIWASCDLRDNVTEPLKYCNKVKYLDIGHNALKDISFIQYMPDLEILIVSCGEIEDISPIKYCQKLKYFECAETYVKDVSPIGDVPSIEDVNIGGNGNMKADFSCLYKLSNPKRIFIQNYYNFEINMEEVGKDLQKAFPDCEVVTSWNGDSAINDHWRYTRGLAGGQCTPQYQMIRDTFEYDDPCGSTRLYDW